MYIFVKYTIYVVKMCTVLLIRVLLQEKCTYSTYMHVILHNFSGLFNYIVIFCSKDLGKFQYLVSSNIVGSCYRSVYFIFLATFTCQVQNGKFGFSPHLPIKSIF